MPSSGMIRGVAPLRTDISEELSACIIRVTRIGELRTLAVTSNQRTLQINKSIIQMQSRVLTINSLTSYFCDRNKKILQFFYTNLEVHII
jgi:hypothetical protein